MEIVQSLYCTIATGNWVLRRVLPLLLLAVQRRPIDSLVIQYLKAVEREEDHHLTRAQHHPSPAYLHLYLRVRGHFYLLSFFFSPTL